MVNALSRDTAGRSSGRAAQSATFLKDDREAPEQEQRLGLFYYKCWFADVLLTLLV